MLIMRPVSAKAAEVPTLAWLEPGQKPLLEAIAAQARLQVIAAGSPSGSARAASLRVEGAEEFTDLRSVLTSTDAKALLLMTGAGAEPIAAAGEQSPLRDAELLRICQTRGITVISLEPIPASTSFYADAPAPGEGVRALPLVPLMAHSKVFADALEAMETLGSPRTVSLSFWSGPGQGTLGARLFDAATVVHALLGVPESIDASIVTRVSVSGVRLAPGETMRDLRGDLTANIRFAGAKAASFSLSDRGGRWFRGLSIVGDGGRMRMDERGFECFTSDGADTDASTHPRRRSAASAAHSPVDPGAVEAIAQAITRATDPRAPKAPPIDHAAVLATCEAAILSARTGQPESPATILRMARVS